MRVGKQKIQALIILAGCTAVLTVAALLQPDPNGFGTHQQIHLPAVAGVTLHLPPCALRSMTGLPCATCGMTTCFANSIRGHWMTAFCAQPFGLVLFILTVGLAVDSAVFLGANRSLRYAPLPWKKILFVLLVLWALSWAWKIVEAVATR